MTYTLEIELMEDRQFGDSWDAIDNQEDYEEEEEEDFSECQ